MEQSSDAQDESSEEEASADPPTARMTQPEAQASEETSQGPRGSPFPEPAPRAGDSASATGTPQETASHGRTSISASVVQKIAAMAAQEISGVHRIGGGSRTFGGLRERIPGGGTASTPGVQVEVGEKQAAVDLDLVVEYGSSIVDIARAVRRNVINGVERMTGLEVIEVNVSINDIHLPADDGVPGRAAPSRVQ